MANTTFGALNPKSQKPGFFGKPPEKSTPAPVSPVQNEVATMSRRLKVLEERHDNTRRHLDFIDQNVQNTQKKMMEELKTSKWELLELHKSLREMEEKLTLLVKEVKLAASKEDVEVIKKYLHYWEPVKFVTRDQVEKITKEKLDELGIYRKE